MKEGQHTWNRALIIAHLAVSPVSLPNPTHIPPVTPIVQPAQTQEQFQVFMPVIATECTPGVLAPADVIAYQDKKLTIAQDLDASGEADEIPPGDLCAYINPDRYIAGTDEFGTFVQGSIFPGDTATTPGSDYSRVEWRQLNPDGTEAAWDSNQGVHTLHGIANIAEYGHDADGDPIEVAFAQIHDATRDPLQLRTKKLGGRTHIVAHHDNEADPNGDKINHILIEDYVPGEIMEFTITVQSNQTTVVMSARGQETMYTFPLTAQGLYFKALNYTQGAVHSGKSAVRYYRATFSDNNQ